MRDAQLKEYAELAAIVGVSPPDLAIEAFKDYLRQKDWGVFPLSEVVSYMDKKAEAESKEKAGWHWRPLREKDHVINASFGVEGRRLGNRNSSAAPVSTPASDVYRGPVKYRGEGIQFLQDANGSVRGVPVPDAIAPSPQNPYDKTIPLHALRKVAAIEREFKTSPVAFFVCDYAPAPQIEYPDPFLMAMIDNPRLNIGIGRFVIDFWDEPGFGIHHQLGV